MALTTFFGVDPLFSQLAAPFFDTSVDRPSRGLQVGDPNLWRSIAGAHPMDVIETPTSYEIHADAPGMTPDEIKVELDDNTLTVSGEHKTEKRHEEGGKVWRRERTFRKFTRSFTLPDDAKADEINASLENGVLRVTVPKAEESRKPQPKRIAVGSTGATGQQTVTAAPAGAGGA